MLIIRAAQLAAFAAHARRAFALEVLERARVAGVETRLAADEALRRVAAGIDAAEGLGFLGRAQAERLAVLSLRHGAAFEAEPWAREILWNGRLTIDERLDRLEAAPTGS